MLHDGHRQRLRERFLTSPDSFADHELIELLLCFSITRRNTNETAHALLDNFGTIKGILDAEMPALLNTAGIGKNSALFLRVISEILLRYEKSEHHSKTPLDSHRALAEYLKSLFVGTTNEITYVLCFDNSRNLLCCKKIAEGYSCGNVVSVRELTTTVISSNAAAVIIVHNHPNGKAIPSGEDIATTNHIKALLNTLGVTFIEHFIVADKQCNPIINSSKAALYNIE